MRRCNWQRAPYPQIYKELLPINKRKTTECVNGQKREGKTPSEVLEDGDRRQFMHMAWEIRSLLHTIQTIAEM